MAQEQLLLVFNALKELEGAVSALYGCFSEKTYGEDKVFWEVLQKAELIHIKHLGSIIEAITNNPDAFITGRPLTLKAVLLVTGSVKEKISGARSGEILPVKFLLLATDIENSLLENKYHEIAKTTDSKFNALTAIIMTDTKAHLEMLKKKVLSQKPGPP